MFGQNLNHVPLMVVLDSTQTVFGLNRVEITISNLTDSTNILMNGESETFEITMNDSTWVPIHTPKITYSWSGRQKYRPKSNRDTIRHFLDLYNLYLKDSFSFQFIMGNGKQIACRYSVDIADPSFTTFKRIVSAPITLKVPPANLDDIAAYNYLTARIDTMTVLEDLSSDFDNSTVETIPVYEYCIQHFPNSAIAAMCALHYSKRLCGGFHEGQKTNQSNQLIIQANRSIIMASTIPLLRSRARFSTRCAD